MSLHHGLERGIVFFVEKGMDKLRIGNAAGPQNRQLAQNLESVGPLAHAHVAHSFAVLIHRFAPAGFKQA
jgi:hypothetical protein